MYPLRFDDRAEQSDPAATFRLADTANGDVQVTKDDAPEYLIEPRGRPLADFAPTCWWQRTSPDSHFLTATICSPMAADDRISISGRTLIRTVGGSRTEEHLATDSAVLSA